MKIKNDQKTQISSNTSHSQDTINKNIITNLLIPQNGNKGEKSSSISPIISKYNNFSYNNSPDRQKDKLIQILKQQNNYLYQKLRHLEIRTSQVQQQSNLSQNNKLCFQINFLKQQIEKLKIINKLNNNIISENNKNQMNQQLKQISKQQKQNQNQDLGNQKQALKQAPFSSQILKQFYQRIQKSSQQSAKLQKKIQQQNTNMINYLNREIQILRTQKLESKKEYLNQFLEKDNQQFKNQKTLSKIKSLSQLPSRIQSLIKEIFLKYQKKVDQISQRKIKIINNILKDYESQISKIKLLQTEICQKIVKLRNKSNIKQNNHKKSQYNNMLNINLESQINEERSPFHQLQTPTRRLKDDQSQLNLDNSFKKSIMKLLNQINDPNKQIFQQNNRIKRQNQLLKQKNQFLFKQIQQCNLKQTQKQQRIYLLQRKIQELNQQQEKREQKNNRQKQAKNSLFYQNNSNSVFHSNLSHQNSSIITPTFIYHSNINTNLSKLQTDFYKQKINILKNELQQKIKSINNFKQQIQHKKRQSQQLKLKNLQLQKLIDINVHDVKKVTQQYNKKLQQALLQNKQLKDLMIKLKQRSEKQQKQYSLIKVQIDQKNKKIQYLKVEMEKRDYFVAQTLRQYICNIQQLKKRIFNPNINNAFQKIQQTEINFINLTSQQHKNQEIIQQLKKKLIQRQKYILDLSNRINASRIQFEQNQSQQLKLANFIQSQSNQQKNQITQIETSKKLQKFQSNQEQSNVLYIKNCLKGIWNGLQKMKNKINIILKQ